MFSKDEELGRLLWGFDTVGAVKIGGRLSFWLLFYGSDYSEAA